MSSADAPWHQDLAPALLSVRFTVSEPVPVNRKYGRRERAADGGFGGKTGLFTRPEAARFETAIGHAALAARSRCLGWPTDPLRVVKARISYQLYDYAGDVDGIRKPLRDAIQRVLIDNDRYVEDGPATFPIADGRGRRVDVYVELLELRSAEAARAIAVQRTRAKIARLLKRSKSTTPKPRVR